MEKQVIVLTFVGEEPTPEQCGTAVVAMHRAGVCMDTTIQPTVCVLSEREQAQAMSMFAMKKASKGEGVTIKVENPALDKKKLAKIAAILKEALDV